MTYDPQNHHRRSISLRDYDYSFPGAYFVTICVQNRKPIFGEIVGDEMHLNAFGERTQLIWNTLPERFPHIELDQFVIMPDHLHGIVFLKETQPASSMDSYVSQIPERFKQHEYSKSAADQLSPSVATPHQPRGAINLAPTGLPSLRSAQDIPPLGEVIRTSKALTTHNIRSLGKLDFKWQSRYFEHIIRNDDVLDRIRQYIVDNPACWAEDSLNSKEALPWLLD